MSEPQPTCLDAVSKKDIVVWLHEHASNEFLLLRKLNGQVKNVAKAQSKDSLIAAYDALFVEKAFRSKKAEPKTSTVENAEASTSSKAAEEEQGPPKYAKEILKKGDKVNFPKKNDMVSVWYTGTLEDGKVFDTNTEKKRGKKPTPLKFKVGTGRVIRGWDEALLTMTKGEKAKLTIEPEWAYGRKGAPDAGIGPNQRLIFEWSLLVSTKRYNQ
ncbi:peptidyl-prolyl cis-trans isomerase FKBP3 [Syncephalis plumigaleata]|nr:peptidyl-prolyl cis-trans isomerase FKBP3 [Syncephalis plumigaleata]